MLFNHCLQHPHLFLTLSASVSKYIRLGKPNHVKIEKQNEIIR